MGYLLSRRALLAGSASGAALLAFSRAIWSAEPAKGGRLVVAADSEPPNLNPAMVASNGVFFVASKVIDGYKFHQAITDAKLRLNASGDATQQAAAKALSELYNSRAGG